MTDKQKLKKALILLEEVLENGEIEVGYEEIENIVNILEDVIESN